MVNTVSNQIQLKQDLMQQDLIITDLIANSSLKIK